VLANLLIGLREGLEAAIVVGILVAFLRKSGRSQLLPQLWLGVGVAVAISLGFGAILTFGSSELSDEAQEAVGGILSILAVGLITWMIFWMAKTARSLKTDLEHRLLGAADAGRWAVATMALLAVGREGLETALYLWAGAQASGSSLSPLIGALLGLAMAIVIGYLIYRGALRLNLREFFRWTGLFLVVIAAGVLAYGVHDLQEAGILPGAESFAFDVSGQLPPGSWYATVLRGIFNVTPQTTWLQLVAWWAYLVPVLVAFVRRMFASTPRPAAVRTA
jgi:high-affinity iron transporter